MLASRHYNVPLAILIGVMATEGGRVGKISYNNNGTWDSGPMQINSCHLEELQQHGITKSMIRDNGCLNVFMGAWRLSKHMAKHPLWEAIGRYHSKTPALNKAYQRRVQTKLRNIKDLNDVLAWANAPLLRR